MAPIASDRAVVQVRSYAASRETHAHAFHQVILPLAGRLELDIGGRGGRVTGPTGALVAAGAPHAFAASARNEFLVLDLPHPVAEEAGTVEWLDRVCRVSFFPVTPSAARLAAWFADEVGSKGAPAAVVTAFTTLLLRAASDPSSRTAPAPVRRALAFIQQNALDPVSVSDVARAAGISSGHLQALFRAYVGRAPLSVLRAHRLEEARRLLRESELPIAEIALRCGFADQASFAHAVRRILGTTPGRLRRHRS